MIEEWKEIYNGKYRCSNLGDIQGKNGNGEWIKKAKYVNKKGYVRVSLFLNKKDVNMALHRVVVEAFLGPIINNLTVNHKNGVKTDNRIENLEVITTQENTAHALANGLKGLSNKLDEFQMLTAATIYNSGYSFLAVSKLFGVHDDTIRNIAKGKNKHHKSISSVFEVRDGRNKSSVLGKSMYQYQEFPGN